jgi:hypothetical protein
LFCEINIGSWGLYSVCQPEWFVARNEIDCRACLGQCDKSESIHSLEKPIMFERPKVFAPVCLAATSLTREIASWILGGLGGLMLILRTAPALAQPVPATFDDHQNMMNQLGIKKLRPAQIRTINLPLTKPWPILTPTACQTF